MLTYRGEESAHTCAYRAPGREKYMRSARIGEKRAHMHAHAMHGGGKKDIQRKARHRIGDGLELWN